MCDGVPPHLLRPRRLVPRRSPPEGQALWRSGGAARRRRTAHNLTGSKSVAREEPRHRPDEIARRRMGYGAAIRACQARRERLPAGAGVRARSRALLCPVPGQRRRSRQHRGVDHRLRPPARPIAQLPSACRARPPSRTGCEPSQGRGGRRGRRRTSPFHGRRIEGGHAPALPGDRARVLPFALSRLQPCRLRSDGVRRCHGRVGHWRPRGPGPSRGTFRSVKPGGNQRRDRTGAEQRSIPRGSASACLDHALDVDRRRGPDGRGLRSTARQARPAMAPSSSGRDSLAVPSRGFRDRELQLPPRRGTVGCR